MQSIRERIARRLEPKAWAALGTGDSLAHRNRRTSSLRKADAVLEELREPDEGMLIAFHDAWQDGKDFADQWRAVIDHARKEER